MSIYTRYLYLFIPLLFCQSGFVHSDRTTEYHCQVHKRLYRVENNKSVEYHCLTDNIWYQDSVGITELNGVHSLEEGGKITWSTIPLGYRLFDMRKKWAYEYRNLSDTAEIVQKYANVDTLRMLGGWHFFTRSVIQFDSVELVGDTLIGGITYIKHRFIQTFKGRKIPGETLSRCDNKNNIFHLDDGLCRATGCAVVKGIALTPDRKFPINSVEIEYISNTFPDSVRKVFDAWKRNVQKFPVE